MNLLDSYFSSFAKRDLAGISALLTDDVVLQDPVVGAVSGKTPVLAEYKKIFDAHSSIEMTLRKIVGDPASSVTVEFTIHFRKASDSSQFALDGIDCITVKNGKISAVRAYLDPIR